MPPNPPPDYELVSLLGQGGFGEVWKARGPGGLLVALKFIRLEQPAGDVELLALELMKDVRHGNLLPLFGAWQRDGMLIIAMELADGTLLDRLRETQSQGHEGIPWEELLEYMREAAKGLDFLNTCGVPADGAVGIQHRDVKPQNLLLVGGIVKVADFGLAKVLKHTVGSASRGLTPAYAAPEFFNNQATRWSDQYSLAVSYCQLRGGRLPFEAEHLLGFALKHAREDPDLSMLPEAERPAVAHALAKRPEKRWPSCRAFADKLAEVSKQAPPSPSAASAQPSPTRSHRRVPPLSSLLLVGLPVGAAAVLGLILFAVLYGSRPDQHRETDPSSTELRIAAVAADKDGAPRPTVRPDEAPRPGLLDCTGPTGVSATEVRRAQAAWATYLGRPVEETVEIAAGVKMTFVLVPPGKFCMGSPAGEKDRGNDETLHEVTLTKPFDLATMELTQAQYQALTGNNPSQFEGPELPVGTVSWTKAHVYAAQLTEKKRDKHLYRLPTEAEWEYACRGGRPSSQPFGIGDGISLSSKQANFNGHVPYGGAGKGACLDRPCRVGSYTANAFGLFDMHGNVGEWCADWYGPYPPGDATNPTGPLTGEERVSRGGGWDFSADYCRAAYRRQETAGAASDIRQGFRLARSLPSGGK